MKKIFALIAIVFAAASVNAQSATANQTVTLNLANAITITASNAGTSFTFDDVTDYESGLTNTDATTFTVKSNRPWNVSVKSQAENFTGPTGNTMPASTVSVKVSTGSTYAPLSTTAGTVTTGARGSSDFKVDYKATPSYNYDSGAYTLSIVYTATQQ